MLSEALSQKKNGESKHTAHTYSQKKKYKVQSKPSAYSKIMYSFLLGSHQILERVTGSRRESLDPIGLVY